ncbi:Ras family, other [Strigomonas culicis]|uniref:Ras family, other n=1 Tax=Strigomonas culicis TaxID=28005 RepID=S9VMW2_9TRYP|nr:Ras family, other [Strigomonas culicis]|eukprot:EPY24580.1 Ras family, other [Strigomonas culicis]
MDTLSIVFLGSSGVGKSSLCLQFCQRYFCGSYEPTLEDAHLTAVTYDDRTVHTPIIDVGGGDSLQALREELLVRDVAFALVYSITERESFSAACHLFAQLQHARQGGAAHCVLVGNKADQHIHRVVALEEGAKFGAEKGIPFVEVSATSYTSTARLFRALVRFSYAGAICNVRCGGPPGGRRGTHLSRVSTSREEKASCEGVV